MVIVGGKEGAQEAFDQRRPWNSSNIYLSRVFPQLPFAIFIVTELPSTNTWARPCEIFHLPRFEAGYLPNRRRGREYLGEPPSNRAPSSVLFKIRISYILVSQGRFFPRSFSCKENLVTMKMPSVFCRQTSPACFICFRTVSTVASITIIELLGRVRYTWSYRFIPTWSYLPISWHFYVPLNAWWTVTPNFWRGICGLSWKTAFALRLAVRSSGQQTRLALDSSDWLVIFFVRSWLCSWASDVDSGFTT